MFGGNGRVRALAARSAVRDGCPQAGVSKANRRRRLLGRRRENLSISAKNKSHPIRVVFCFYMVEGEIRIMSEHAGGMFIGQFKNWPILLSDFSVPRKEKPDAGESLHLRHKKQISHHWWGICFFYLWLERFEQGTSEARETCRGHVSVSVCVPALLLFCHFLHSVL